MNENFGFDNCSIARSYDPLRSKTEQSASCSVLYFLFPHSQICEQSLKSIECPKQIEINYRNVLSMPTAVLEVGLHCTSQLTVQWDITKVSTHIPNRVLSHPGMYQIKPNGPISCKGQLGDKPTELSCIQECKIIVEI